MVLGAQLYTVREYIQTERDLQFTLEKIAKMGYTTVQVSGIAKLDAPMVRRVCDSYGLKIVLVHSSQERILHDTEALIEEYNVLGCDYVGIGSMPDRYRTEAWFDRFIVDYKEPAQKIAKAGKLLMYHNHAFEFAKVRGERMIDRLLKGFSTDEMGFTLDTYWVQAAGADVCHWINVLGDRIPCVHLKDMDVTISQSNGTQVVMAPVMEGNMNFPAILEAIKKAGKTKYLLVEQDTCQEDPFICLEKSYKNLTTLGYR